MSIRSHAHYVYIVCYSAHSLGSFSVADYIKYLSYLYLQISSLFSNYYNPNPLTLSTFPVRGMRRKPTTFGRVLFDSGRPLVRRLRYRSPTVMWRMSSRRDFLLQGRAGDSFFGNSVIFGKLEILSDQKRPDWISPWLRPNFPVRPAPILKSSVFHMTVPTYLTLQMEAGRKNGK